MVLTKTHGIDKDLWYRQGLMVLTTPMVLIETHGIESVLLNNTRTRGTSVTRMRDLLCTSLRCHYHYRAVGKMTNYTSGVSFSLSFSSAECLARTCNAPAPA